MYDAEMLAAASLTDEQMERIRGRKANVITATREMFDDINFDRAVRQGTNTPSRLLYRTERVRDMLASV
jgi:hypothetical protein